MLIRMEGEGDKLEGLSVLVDIQNRHIERPKRKKKKVKGSWENWTFCCIFKLLKLESKLMWEPNSIRV